MNGDLRQIIESNSVPVPEAGCWLWERSIMGGGYGDFRLGDQHFLAHRASYEAFKGPIPDGLQVLHSCDTRCCVNPAHLSTGTNTDNIHDCCRKARNAKLSNAQVVEIREARASGESGASLSRRFGVNEGQITAITSGRQRRFVGGPITPTSGVDEAALGAFKADYSEGRGSIRALAKKHGLSYGTAHRNV